MKSPLLRQWPLIGLGLVLAAVAFYLIRSGKELIKDPLVAEVMSGEGIKLKDIQYAQDDPDKEIKWVLNAGEVRFSEDRKSIFFKDFHLKVIPENSPFFELKGSKGDYSRDSGEINLWGDLEGVSGNGYRIVSEHLMINERLGHVSTEEPVKIFGPFFSVSGKGLIMDLKKESAKILSDVTTTIEQEFLI
jgi:LPS export ABC transporter protein LptC